LGNDAIFVDSVVEDDEGIERGAVQQLVGLDGVTLRRLLGEKLGEAVRVEA
jgi:hypothetical protein